MLLGDEVDYNNVCRDIILDKHSLRSTSWSGLFSPTIRYS
jgi:hypothetical protein